MKHKASFIQLSKLNLEPS
jgi:hypothetical protein